jgi:hypothetical protein
MQNRYVGDIGDYSKFVLIKHLFNKKVGVIWYLYPNEGNGDGKFRNYENYDLNDKEIVNIMKKFSEVEEDKRNIQELENELKNNNFTFLSDCIEEDCIFDSKNRRTHRENWFDNALKKVQNCDVVFADPDNGTQIKSLNCSKGRKKSGKYIFFDEINKLLENHKTVVIYQHFERSKTHKLLIDEKEKKLRKELKDKEFNFYAIKFKRVSTRAYLILSKENLKGEIEKFCNKFTGEFELIKES